MTKDEAVNALTRLAYSPISVGRCEFKDRCIAILDQIDPPPHEFSVWELCKLITKSPTVGSVLVYDESMWEIRQFDEPNIESEGIDELKAKLIELANPPKPTTGMVELPIGLINRMASWDDDYARAAKAALAKLEQPS